MTSASFGRQGGTQEIVIPYVPRAGQGELHEAKESKRFVCLVCHRRWGKTVFAINELVKAAITSPHRPGQPPRCAYMAPLLKQAKAIAWDYLRYYTAVFPGVKVYENELRVVLPGGAQIQLFGADNPDALRGVGLDMAVLDEFGQMHRRAWSEVIRPTLADRKGHAIVLGTPQGKNAFYELYEATRSDPEWMTEIFRASDTGVIEESELASLAKSMSAEHYQQEMECSWSAGIRGSYYASLLEEADADDRVGDYPAIPNAEVQTAWDIGVGDATSIWFIQRSQGKWRVIDYFEAEGEGLSFYAKALAERPYKYGRHWAPPDILNREWGNDAQTRLEMARSLGIKFDVVPKFKLEDGIEAVRNILPLCSFDQRKCKDGLDALRNYKRELNERTGEFAARPLHDWSSHGADAFRYFAISHKRSARTTGGHLRLVDEGRPDTSWVV